jgi:hypothetical protein
MAAVPRDRAGMGSATNDTTRELGGALGVAVLGSLLTSEYASGVATAAAGLPSAVQDEVEGGLGGAIGLNVAGLVPDSVVTAAKGAFVDGLGLATAVSAVVVAIAAVLVYKFLPSDRHSLEVSGEGDEVEPDAARFEAHEQGIAPIAGG